MLREEIMKNVYHAAQFQSIRWRSSEKIITQRLENNREQVENYLNNESYFALSYYLQFTFLRLIYDYNLEQNYKESIPNIQDSSVKLYQYFQTTDFYKILNND